MKTIQARVVFSESPYTLDDDGHARIKPRAEYKRYCPSCKPDQEPDTVNFAVEESVDINTEFDSYRCDSCRESLMTTSTFGGV